MSCALEKKSSLRDAPDVMVWLKEWVVGLGKTRVFSDISEMGKQLIGLVSSSTNCVSGREWVLVKQK